MAFNLNPDYFGVMDNLDFEEYPPLPQDAAIAGPAVNSPGVVGLSRPFEVKRGANFLVDLMVTQLDATVHVSRTLFPDSVVTMCIWASSSGELWGTRKFGDDEGKSLLKNDGKRFADWLVLISSTNNFTMLKSLRQFSVGDHASYFSGNSTTLYRVVPVADGSFELFKAPPGAPPALPPAVAPAAPPAALPALPPAFPLAVLPAAPPALAPVAPPAAPPAVLPALFAVPPVAPLEGQQAAQEAEGVEMGDAEMGDVEMEDAPGPHALAVGVPPGEVDPATFVRLFFTSEFCDIFRGYSRQRLSRLLGHNGRWTRDLETLAEVPGGPRVTVWDSDERGHPRFGPTRLGDGNTARYGSMGAVALASEMRNFSYSPIVEDVSVSPEDRCPAFWVAIDVNVETPDSAAFLLSRTDRAHHEHVVNCVLRQAVIWARSDVVRWALEVHRLNEWDWSISIFLPLSFDLSRGGHRLPPAGIFPELLRGVHRLPPVTPAGINPELTRGVHRLPLVTPAGFIPFELLKMHTALGEESRGTVRTLLAGSMLQTFWLLWDELMRLSTGVTAQ